MRRLAFLVGIAALLAIHEPPARACGCLSPPAPAVVPGDYAINQSAEQIIFETTPGWVTAHVLIRYSGDPSQFAWIVPVPEVPTELGISPVSAFGLLDQATGPQLSIAVQDACPQSAWICHYDEPSPSFGCGGAAKEAGAFPTASGDASVGALDAGGGAPPVQVISTQTVGDYQTVTFRASEASAATQWLHDNGFIVNQTTSIFMESYIQQNMVFLAAKLLPGAGVSAIKPLRMKYRADYPMVPLVLTAVAAQPNLTVTAFVYGSDPFRPMGHPVVTIDGGRLAADPAGRINYPMVLARTIDEAGGDAFAIEYRGYSSPSVVGESTCCTGGNDDDFCGLGNDGQCECPGDSWDATDCASDGDLVDGVTLLNQLGQTYPSLTRITTRISPEEMTFDPQFEPDPGALATGNLTVSGSQISVANCSDRVIDHQVLADTTARAGCTSMYCGPQGQCVTTASGPACACNAGFVAQQFTDLDDHPSVTCVPQTPPCDLRAGGDVLPDACAGVSCGAGECIDRNGVAVCACNPGAAATLGATAPHCDTIAIQTMTPGAQNYSSALAGIHVCAPVPPDCGDAKLERIDVDNPGVDCGDATPPADKQYSPSSGGCQQSRSSQGVTFMAMLFAALVVVVRRRRR